MSDLPDRLRAEAAALARFSRKLSLTGNHTEGCLLGEQAGLMRAAADEIERLRQETSDNRLAASVEAGERRRAHARVAELEANQDALRGALNGLREWVQSVVGHAPPEATDDDQIGWLDAGLCETDARLCHIIATLLKPSPASSPIVKAEEESTPL
jgi:hypothetical protein